MPARFMKAAAVLIAFLAAPPAFAQGTDGAQVFAATCSNCHNGAADSRAPALDALRSRAPALDALRSRAPEAIVEALMTGAMRAQGSRLSGAERRAVAEFVTGKGMGGDVTGAAKGRCAAAPSTGAIRDFAIVPHWTGWSPSPTNTRFQPADQAALAATDVSPLVLKWSFGFPDASVAWCQPTVADGR